MKKLSGYIMATTHYFERFVTLFQLEIILAFLLQKRMGYYALSTITLW